MELKHEAGRKKYVWSSSQFLAQSVGNPWRFLSDGVRGTSLVFAISPLQPYLSLWQKGDSSWAPRQLQERGWWLEEQPWDLRGRISSPNL